MAAKLYMDVHIPAAIAAGLRRRGIDVLTGHDDDTIETDDAELLRRATELERVLFTQDQDFLRLGTEWQRSGSQFRGIIFSKQLGPGIGQLIDELEFLLTAADVWEFQNRVIHLPLQ